MSHTTIILVVTGFIQAAAFAIPLGQVNKLFGVSKEVRREGFVGLIIDIFEELIAGNANWYDFGVGMGSIVLLVILGKVKAYRIGYFSVNITNISCDVFLKPWKVKVLAARI